MKLFFGLFLVKYCFCLLLLMGYIPNVFGMDHLDEPIAPFLSDEWRPLSVNESMHYLTLYETCNARTRNYRDQCEPYKRPIDLELGECAVNQNGIGHVNAICPMMHRLMIHSSTKPYPEGKNILSMIKTMKDHGSNTLLLIGDSITGQSFGDIQCSLRRYGMLYERPNDGNILLLKSPIDNTNEQYFQIIYFNYFNDQAQDFSFIQQEITNLLHIQEKNQENTNHYLMVEGSIVIIFNVGIHYNAYQSQDILHLTKVYQKTFAYFLLFANHSISHPQNNNNNNQHNNQHKLNQHLIIFRETSAQHFTTLDGSYQPTLHVPYYQMTKDNHGNHQIEMMTKRIYHQEIPSNQLIEYHNIPNFSRCSPIHHEIHYETQNWRNQLAKKILHEMDSKKLIKIAMFYRLTAARHDIHFQGGDCTHYCHGPLLWLPLWNQIDHLINHHYEEYQISNVG